MIDKAIAKNQDKVEHLIRTNGGANPGNPYPHILLASLLAELVEQNDKIIALLSKESKEPVANNACLCDKKETKPNFDKQKILLGQLFKNGEERKISEVIEYLKVNNADIPFETLESNGILHKNKRYTCKFAKKV